MKTDLLLPVATAALLAMMVLGLSPETVEARQESHGLNGIYEEIQFTDLTIDYVTTFPGKRE